MRDVEWSSPWTIGLALAGVGTLAHAAWMLVDPAGWYANLPAAVPDTGPLNRHFVRDIGGAFAATGVAFLWAALRPPLRVPLLAVAGVFYVAHALIHVADTLAGRLPPSHWVIDAPGVYLPALVMVAVTAAALRDAPR